MNKQWLLPAVLVLGTVILVTEWNSDSTDNGPLVTTQPAAPADSTPVTMQWRYGVTQRYHVLSESSMQMQATVRGASTIHVHMLGQLDTLTLETGGDEAVVGMRFSSIELKINDSMDAGTNLALGVPFRVRFAASGMPLAFAFPAEVNQQNRSILENLVRTFQISMDSVDNWVVNESNGSGTYQAAYKRTGPAQFKKSKRKFTSTVTGIVSWSEISSTESFSIEAGRNWITEMNVQETMSADDQGGPAMTVSNHATLKLRPETQLALSPDLWRFDAAAAVDATSALKRPVPNITPEKARKQILATVPELDAATQGRLGLIHRLRDLLRVDASLPAIILDLLKTQELSDRTRADLYLVLEQAGTKSAQAALVEVITDDSWSLKDGMRAIVAMGGVKQPTTESITALWDMAQYSSGGEHQRMANTATFALGSIGNTMNKTDNPEYAALRSDLLSNALGSGDVTQRSNYITALGNTHDTTLANEVAILLDDAEPAIRRAAALSLGSLGTDQVADRLVSHYSAEDNGYVRGAIAESLQSWTEPSDSAMAMFRQTVRTETDESTRYNIAVLLSDNLDKFPENEPVLREIMRNEPSKRIRQKVAEALSVYQSQS
ncbi:MAG: HEAT repeat domain-containing protein [Proteobacteria bacterium]|nr:HEAT repeat domain-containing protein [Pseudomonadota bacterium]